VSNLAQLRPLLRIDLADAGAATWADGDLDRHLARAVQDYSLAVPLEKVSTLQTSAGSRVVSIATLAHLMEVVAVEYPVGQYPMARVAFSLWQANLTLHSIGEPQAVEDVRVFWTAPHTIAEGSHSFPNFHDPLIVTGAAGYAALEWASRATNRLNTGGDDVYRRYRDFARERLARFREELQRHARDNRVRQRRMFATDEPSHFTEGRLKY
jgi:hypothetical protein